jgi:hypothetical protein
MFVRPCMGLSESRGFFLRLVQFLCSTEGTVSSSRPEFRVAARATAVKTGGRPPPQAARSGLDGGEHGARLGGSGPQWWFGGKLVPGGLEGARHHVAEFPRQPCIR